MTRRDQTILLLGATGQVGHELARQLPVLGPMLAPSRRELDLADDASIREYLQAAKPGLVVNAAAYTKVDRAQSEVDACVKANAVGPGVLAKECQRLGAALVHFSTDHVFDGASRVAYAETDRASPLNVYGATKLAGEGAVASGCESHLVFRTSWIYGPRGRNFAANILRLAHERTELTVVDDQIGAPTSAGAVAQGVLDVLRSLSPRGTWAAAMAPASGVYHMTAGGSTSWYEFALRVLVHDPRREAQTCRIVRPVPTSEFPTPARRPAFSLLDNGKLAERFRVRLPSWEDQWRVVARDLDVLTCPASVEAMEVHRADRSLA